MLPEHLTPAINMLQIIDVMVWKDKSVSGFQSSTCLEMSSGFDRSWSVVVQYKGYWHTGESWIFS